MVNRYVVRLFESRKGHLDYRVKRDYIRNGIATIPCRVTDYSDVISTYSVKGYETLNPEFFEYLKTTAEITPSDSPLVLNIIGDCLTQEEKKTISEIIADDLAYYLGNVEKTESRHTRIFFIMFFGLIISAAILWFPQYLADVPRELFFILLWFTGETLCDYIFMTGYELRRERRLAGRLASVKVIFSERYEEPHYTDSDLDTLLSEIEKGVNDTLSI